MDFQGTQDPNIYGRHPLTVNRFALNCRKSNSWNSMKCCCNLYPTSKRASLRQLPQLAGCLNWACQVDRGGRVYLRLILDLKKPLKFAHHKIVLPDSSFAGIHWWLQFLPMFNGKCSVLKHMLPCMTCLLMLPVLALGLCTPHTGGVVGGMTLVIMCMIST